MIRNVHISTVLRYFVFISSVLVFALITSSCGIQRNSFSKQKYTKFKTARTAKFRTNSSKKSYPENETTAYVEHEEGPITTESTISFLSAQNISNATDRIENEEVSLNQIPSGEVGVGHSTDLSQPIVTNTPGNPRNFHKLSSKEQAEALIDFNWLANAILFLVLGAFAMVIVGILIASWGPWIFMGIFFFTSWIISLVGITKVKRISSGSQSKQFRLKYVLVNIVAWIGIVVSIVTIGGGLVLLVLWLTRVL